MLAALDLLLCAGLLGLAVQLLLIRNRYHAVLAFIVFGLLMALVWARLRAVDVALAEAAIGAGLTGALLIAAVSRLSGRGGHGSRIDRQSKSPGSASGPWSFVAKRASLGALSVGLTAIVVWAVINLPSAPERLRTEVLGKLQLIGIDNPVTAVLLDFRGYDTVLEVGVLVLALVVVWSLAPRQSAGGLDLAGPSLDGLVRLLIPVVVLVAGYLLWQGANHPGGAFQAGAVLAGGGVLIALARPHAIRHFDASAMTRPAIVLGLLVFILIGLGTGLHTGNFLRYPPGQAPSYMLVIEIAATISIAAILFSLFLGGRPPGPMDEPRESAEEKTGEG